MQTTYYGRRAINPQARKVLRELPSLVDISVPDEGHITVCGDVHGQVRTHTVCACVCVGGTAAAGEGDITVAPAQAPHNRLG